MRVKTIEDALTLILLWTGRADIAVPARVHDPDMPAGLSTVVAVSDALGEGAFTPVNAPLLSVQDRIIRPENLRTDSGGYTTFVVENQGVHSFGFRPGAPDRLFISGDWGAIPEGTVPPGWRSVSMRPEDGLILTVLINGFLGLASRLNLREEADFDTVPVDCDVPVWTNPALGRHSPGFWTNADSTRLYFGGFGQTLMR